jgi:hypothetical protein
MPKPDRQGFAGAAADKLPGFVGGIAPPFSASQIPSIQQWLANPGTRAPLAADQAHASSLEDPSCPICFEDLTPNNSMQLTCRHLICGGCLLAWGRTKMPAVPKCPLDNQPIGQVFSGTFEKASASASGDGKKGEPARKAPVSPTTALGRDALHELKSFDVHEDNDANGDGNQALLPLPAPFSRQSKVQALQATLRDHVGKRSMLFCCPEELAYYESVVRASGLRTTREVGIFKADAEIAIVMLPHSQAAGANLPEASLLIRISIDQSDPGQAVQQRG